MLVLVAGPIAVGKTAFARELAQQFDAHYLSVRAALLDSLGTASLTRAELQREGADLDRRTAGRWLLNYVVEHIESTPNIVVDSIRTKRQAQPLLNTLPGCLLTYLDAGPGTRRLRYASGAVTDPLKASTPFEVAMSHPTEDAATHLRWLADLTVDTDGLSVDEVVREAVQGLYLVRDP